MQYIRFPSGLTGFCNSKTTVEMALSGREVYLLHGELERYEPPHCPACGQKMHIHGSRITALRHLRFGSRLSAVSLEKRRYRCPYCGHTEMESIPFKADGHNITRELLRFTRDLLAYGFTNKEVSELTGLSKNTVKEIDLQRLKGKYTADGTTLIKPEKQARFLSVDEFKLHNGYKYASLIIDMESGHKSAPFRAGAKSEPLSHPITGRAFAFYPVPLPSAPFLPLAGSIPLHFCKGTHRAYHVPRNK